ncbi:MAG: peptidoglycan-binding protein [Micropruina sp.]|uniref:peptidoglycan-binding protein n=1 Tax=Micropruina sp. TaxID=2737536 RepID=UPI0039E4233F
MTTSQNGWPVQDTKAKLWPHPEVGPILGGPVWVVMAAFLRRYQAEIETIGRSSGCYNRRRIAGSTKWSNHASATAVDLNWNLHPAGAQHTGYSARQITDLTALLAEFPVLRWGGPAFNDPMHYEIRPGVTRAQVKKLATTLLQKQLLTHGFALEVDGVRGAVTTAALLEFQRAQGLEADGVDGPKTWSALLTTSTVAA